MTQQAGELAGTVRREAASALTEPLEQISGAPLSSTSFGQRMIKRGEAQLQSFKNRATELWDRIRAFPEANQPAFNMTPIKRDARKMLDELVKTEEGEVAKGLAPAGVSPTLSSIENLADDASYFDLVKLRDAVYDRIGSPEPISDKGTRLLKSLGASITKELHTQGPKVFGSRKWADVEIANQFYRENVESFYQKGIVGMLKPRTEAGAIDPEKVAASLLSGGKGSVTTYNTFRDFFEKAGAIKDMNRMLRDQLIDAGTDRMTGLVKLEDFTAGLARMEPELVQEIYGVSKKELLTDAQRAQQGLRVIAGKGKALPERGGGTQAEIEADAFKEALATGKVKSGVLKALATTTDEIQRAYSKELTKALGMGDTRLIEAAPERFVRDFLLNPATSERAAQNAMQHLMATGDDLLVGDVRRLYLADLFKAGAAGAKGDVQQLVSMQTGSPLRNLDPQKLAVIMEDTGVQKRMDLILGPDVAKAVREFGIALSGQPGRDAAATATGSFAGGTYTHALIQALGGKVGALAALPDLAKYRLLSYLITSPDSIKTLRTVANLVPADFTALAKTMALSPEFAHAIASDSTTPEEAAEVTRAIQQWATTPESNAPPQR